MQSCTACTQDGDSLATPCKDPCPSGEVSTPSSATANTSDSGNTGQALNTGTSSLSPSNSSRDAVPLLPEAVDHFVYSAFALTRSSNAGIPVTHISTLAAPPTISQSSLLSNASSDGSNNGDSSGAGSMSSSMLSQSLWQGPGPYAPLPAVLAWLQAEGLTPVQAATLIATATATASGASPAAVALLSQALLATSINPINPDVAAYASGPGANAGKAHTGDGAGNATSSSALASNASDALHQQQVALVPLANWVYESGPRQASTCPPLSLSTQWEILSAAPAAAAAAANAARTGRLNDVVQAAAALAAIAEAAGSTVQRVSSAGCPCNATANAAAMRCPAGQRCSAWSARAVLLQQVRQASTPCRN